MLKANPNQAFVLWLKGWGFASTEESYHDLAFYSATLPSLMVRIGLNAVNMLVAARTVQKYVFLNSPKKFLEVLEHFCSSRW